MSAFSLSNPEADSLLPVRNGSAATAVSQCPPPNLCELLFTCDMIALMLLGSHYERFGSLDCHGKLCRPHRLDATLQPTRGPAMLTNNDPRLAIIKNVIQSAEGLKAMVLATSKAQPALAGVDGLLCAAQDAGY